MNDKSKLFKNLVRERMQATGEHYTTAYRVLLKAAELGARPGYWNAPPVAILPRIAAQYPDGKGEAVRIFIRRPVYLFVRELEAAGGRALANTADGMYNIRFELNPEDENRVPDDGVLMNAFLAADENGRLALIDEWTDEAADEITRRLGLKAADSQIGEYQITWQADVDQAEAMRLAELSDFRFTVDQVAWLNIQRADWTDTNGEGLAPPDDDDVIEPPGSVADWIAAEYSEYGHGEHHTTALRHVQAGQITESSFGIGGYVADLLDGSADWRDGVAVRYPEDGRNEKAAAAQHEMAEWVRALPDDDADLVRLHRAVPGNHEIWLESEFVTVQGAKDHIGGFSYTEDGSPKEWISRCGFSGTEDHRKWRRATSQPWRTRLRSTGRRTARRGNELPWCGVQSAGMSRDGDGCWFPFPACRSLLITRTAGEGPGCNGRDLFLFRAWMMMMTRPDYPHSQARPPAGRRILPRYPAAQPSRRRGDGRELRGTTCPWSRTSRRNQNDSAGWPSGSRQAPARLAYTRDLMTAPGERVTRRGASYVMPIILLEITPAWPLRLELKSQCSASPCWHPGHRSS
jgi:hypothetical protein